tara:strand:+ start:1278 stop:2369 length:1092 start_codon:yes stop_codon:yes gene_type:complete
MKTPHYSKIHNRFLLNGYFYDKNTLKEVAYDFIKEGDQYECFLGDFLLDWLDNSDSVYLESSVSSPQPKKFLFKKQSLVNSAISTGNFFGISVGDIALHCLPANYIAGKMMLIRAMILGLEIDLISPSKTPFYKNQKTYDFVAMTPMQAFHSLSKLKKVKKLILGGAYVSSALQKSLINSKVTAFETYGMMETLSHIAVRTMLDPVSEFKCLPGIKVSQDKRNCLVIDAPYLNVSNLVTNDEVELISPTHFRLIGRIDHIICSGDIKLHPEQIERKLSENLSFHFFIDSISDPLLGEKVVLVIKDDPEIKFEKLQKEIKKCTYLKSYEVPKAVICLKDFIQTYSGKIKRKDTMSQKPIRVLNL